MTLGETICQETISAATFMFHFRLGFFVYFYSTVFRDVKTSFKVLLKCREGLYVPSAKGSKYYETSNYFCVVDGDTLGIVLFYSTQAKERKERSETFENEIIQHVNYTDILPMFFL